MTSGIRSGSAALIQGRVEIEPLEKAKSLANKISTALNILNKSVYEQTTKHTAINAVTEAATKHLI